MMKRVVSGLVVVALTLTGAACRDSTGPATALDVRASVARLQYRVGDTVTVPVEIENTGARAVQIPGSLYSFLEVRDAAGKVVFFGRSGIFTMVAYPPRTLEPGERVNDVPFWGGVVIGPAQSVAAPGTYRLRAAVHPRGKNAHYVFSAPLDVRIAP